jgi:hypothetical protein
MGVEVPLQESVYVMASILYIVYGRAGRPRDARGGSLQVSPHGLIAELGLEQIYARGFARARGHVVVLAVVWARINRRGLGHDLVLKNHRVCIAEGEG